MSLQRLSQRTLRPCAVRCAAGRSIHASALRRNEGLNATRRAVATEENQDIMSMDRLLRAVKQSADPTYHRTIPLRTPLRWSEVLLDTARTSTPSETEENLPLTQPPQTPRHSIDSYSEIVLPFSSSPNILEDYVNASGGIRTGKLMEHLDSLAGSIAYKHMLGPDVQTLGKIKERGFYIVTASVDRLDMLTPLDPSRDVLLSGQVIYTGKSSMEVAVKMESIGGDRPTETVLLGRFSMVCRDATTHKAREVNPLIITTPEEQRLYGLGEQMKIRRQSNAQRSLSKVPPSSEEAAALHSFYLQYGQKNLPATMEAHRVWMGDTKQHRCMLMFPQERNVHQKVFGGYLMRLAYELGFTNASMFTGARHVRFLSLDGISFARPVPIGSILRLTSSILHTSERPGSDEGHSRTVVHVGVKANVVDVATGEEHKTNDFRFTWMGEHDKAMTPRQVVFKTYKEAMLWLEGRRALELGDAIRRMRQHGM